MTLTLSPTAENGFIKALNSFKARLTASERTEFSIATLDDLQVTILTIQREQCQRKKMMHMGRIQSFLEAMEQFTKVIEVFLNTSSVVAFIWGPMKFLLLVFEHIFHPPGRGMHLTSASLLDIDLECDQEQLSQN